MVLNLALWIVLDAVVESEWKDIIMLYIFRFLTPMCLVLSMKADSGIVMVDGCFMVDGPCVNHAEKAVNHVLWLTGFLGRWLTEPCLMSNFELSGHQFGTILKSFILTFQCASI